MCTGGGKEREEEGNGGTKGREIEEGRIEWKGERMEAPLGKTIRTAFPSYVINATPSRDLLAECCAAKICNLLPRQGCDLSTRRIAFSSDREISETLLSITMPPLPPSSRRGNCLLETEGSPPFRASSRTRLSVSFQPLSNRPRLTLDQRREESERKNGGGILVAESQTRNHELISVKGYLNTGRVARLINDV